MSDSTNHAAELSAAKQALLARRRERALAAIGRGQDAGITLAQPIPRRKDAADPPLSYGQEDWWAKVQLKPDDPWGCIIGLRIKGPLRVEVFEHSLDEIMRRHEPLRTTFAVKDDRPVQIIAPPSPFRLRVVDLTGFEESAREQEVQRQAVAQAEQRFDLARGPLFQVTLYRLADEEYVVLLTRHRMLLDGWSSGVLLRELLSLYNAFSAERPSPLPELPIQFADYVCWQRRWLRSAEGAEHLAYWKRQLAGATPVRNLPYDRPRPGGHTVSSSKGQYLILSEALSEAAQALSRREGVTLFMTALATFFALLHRYTGQGDLCIATSAASRTRSETEPLVGVFLNTLVLRARMSGDTTFRELLRHVREVTTDAFAHQEVPFAQVADAVAPDTSAGYAHPLTRVRCRYESSAVVGVGAKLRHGAGNKTKGLNMALPAGLTFGRFDFDYTVSFPDDLSLGVQDSPGGISLSMDYAAEWFEAATVMRILQDFQSFLEAVVPDPHQPLAAVPL